jgi:uncharacterized phiE125 gp8 family phage protein
MMRVASIPGPAASVVSTADLKAHLRVDFADEDAAIEDMGLAATALVERWTQRILSPRSAVLRLAALPPGATPLALPGGLVNSLTSLVVDGVALAGLTVIGDSPAVVVPDADWPVATGSGFPVVVTYNVGYAMAPEPLRHAVKLIAAELYERRSNGVTGTMTTPPVSAEYLMSAYRIRPV